MDISTAKLVYKGKSKDIYELADGNVAMIDGKAASKDEIYYRLMIENCR